MEHSNSYKPNSRTGGAAINRKPRQCLFCIKNINHIDYKDGMLLKRFVSSYGKIVARKRSGVCPKHQRKLSDAIKKARIMALLPFVQR